MQLQLYITGGHRELNRLFGGQFSYCVNLKDNMKHSFKKANVKNACCIFLLSEDKPLFCFSTGFWCTAWRRPQQKDSKSRNLLLPIVWMTFTLTASSLSVIIQGCTSNDRMRDFAYWVSRSPWKHSEITVIYSYWQGKVHYESSFVFTGRWRVEKLHFLLWIKY